MKEQNPQYEEREEFRELLKTYENFKNGQNHSFIEEESFEKPDWLGDEVTNDERYYNAYLSKNPFKNWQTI